MRQLSPSYPLTSPTSNDPATSSSLAPMCGQFPCLSRRAGDHVRLHPHLAGNCGSSRGSYVHSGARRSGNHDVNSGASHFSISRTGLSRDAEYHPGLTAQHHESCAQIGCRRVRPVQNHGMRLTTSSARDGAPSLSLCISQKGEEIPLVPPPGRQGQPLQLRSSSPDAARPGVCGGAGGRVLAHPHPQ